VLRPKFVVARPQPEATVIEQTPAVEQQAPVTQGLPAQVVPAPWNVWLLVEAHPAMVFDEQTPAVEQHAPVRTVQVEAPQVVPLPMYVSPAVAPHAPAAPLPAADLVLHVAPSALQQAPVGTVQGVGEQAVPVELKMLGRAHAVLSVTVHAPLVPQHPPEVVVQGVGEQVEPTPAKLAGAAAVPQLAAVTLAVHVPVSGQHAPRNGLQMPVVQVDPMPRNVFVPEQLLEAVIEQVPVPLQQAPAQALGEQDPPEMKIRAPVHPVVVAVQVVPEQHAPVWACVCWESPRAAAAIHSAAAQRIRSFMVMSPYTPRSGGCGRARHSSRPRD
jgi:hypothetical protein